MPDHGRIQMEMVILLQRAEVLKAAQVVKVDLAVILALAPPALRVRPGDRGSEQLASFRSLVIGCSLRSTTSSMYFFFAK